MPYKWAVRQHRENKTWHATTTRRNGSIWWGKPQPNWNRAYTLAHYLNTGKIPHKRNGESI